MNENDTSNVIPAYLDSELCSFAHYRPRVFARVLRLPYLVGTLLNWRTSSKTLLWHLLGLLDDETDFVEIAHADLAASLWPDVNVHSGRNKLTRWLGRFDEDQFLSKFSAVERRRGKYTEKGGEKEFFPSKYRLAGFYQLAESVGAEIMSKHLLEVEPLRARHSAHRAVVATVLIDLGASPILPCARAEALSKKKWAAKDRPKKHPGVTPHSPEFHSLSLQDRLDILLSDLFELSDMAFGLCAETETYEEAESIVASVLKHQASHAAAALRTRRMRQAEANKPRGRRVAIEPASPLDLRHDNIVLRTLEKAGIGNQ